MITEIVKKTETLINKLSLIKITEFIGQKKLNNYIELNPDLWGSEADPKLVTPIVVFQLQLPSLSWED